VKIALCQVNPKLGNFTYNLNKVKSFYEKAIKAGAELVIFPEMVVCGYPPQDLIWENGFVSACESSIQTIASFSKIPLIAGFIRKEKNKIFNSAALCRNGEIVFIYDKMLLPTYDVFDEDRYFSPGKNVGLTEVDIGGRPKKIGIQICEDLWDMDYELKVTNELAQRGAQMIINISASPFHDEQPQIRKTLIEEKISETNTHFVYCNLVGAQDELIFDGNSVVYNNNGEVIGSGQSFSEDIVFVNMDSTNIITEQVFNREESLYSALCLGVKDYFDKTGHKKAVMGLSGGIDSSLTACIAVDALGEENVWGITMPSEFSSEHSLTDSEKLAQNLGISVRSIPIEKLVNDITRSLKPIFKNAPPSVAEENIQARIRGLLLMAISNKFGWLVLTTGNKTELALGYCTLYGDMNGGLAVISDLSKQEVYAVSRWVNESAGFDRIPEDCITKPPSAELAPDQRDPFDYDVVSPIVESIVQDRLSINDLLQQGLKSSLVLDIAGRIRLNEYKRRQAAPGLRVSSKAFGIGRRYPIINHYKK
tara:strand:+ start:34769 stop:36376 length:1608 start_codon:yes stop_codon:yes gene_type:complete